jgi:hypothetical protein
MLQNYFALFDKQTREDIKIILKEINEYYIDVLKLFKNDKSFELFYEIILKKYLAEIFIIEYNEKDFKQQFTEKQLKEYIDAILLNKKGNVNFDAFDKYKKDINFNIFVNKLINKDDKKSEKNKSVEKITLKDEFKVII